MAERRSYTVTTVVLAISTLLFGGASAAVVWFASLIVLPWILAPLSLADWTRVGAIVIGGAVGLKVSLEAARVWLHGWPTLLRGTGGQRLIRHAILLLPVVAVGVMTSLVVLGGVTDPGVRERPWILVLVVAVGICIAWVLLRTFSAYREGRRRAIDDS